MFKVAKRFTEFYGYLKNFSPHGKKLEINSLGAELQYSLPNAA
jgi:hypothetical protein